MSQKLNLEEWTARINEIAMHEVICPLLTRPGIAGQYKPETCVCTVPSSIKDQCQKAHGACADLNTGRCLPLRYYKDDIRTFEAAERERLVRREAVAYQRSIGNPAFA